MDYIKDLHELCETLSDAIAEANEKIRNSGGKLTAGDTAYIDQLTHALKSVKAVIVMDDDGYSGMYDRGYPRSYRRSYRGSYRRDSRGRYANDGYSRGGDMVEELRELMHDAPDEKTKQEFQRFINKIEAM